ncbi:Hsp70/Hsp90 co-chaperone cns1 [Fulvia fulva]|uniref:Hsp70/Hsp90 co-chaperone cns1 n=1 Tax=Passalora fulva TaxID=5499 RepID=A0A9Q8PG04_PASFU|nr:Hsp70/Hsp90 co-chaperone cns1 [Fulvia fulva]KAK4613921.1 Hsp70/Hsp90 co-chaperone cns1 [Fulvia fulva]UJO21725.1 Hsp70/Hsp90 co-chaperone cns1 [Fulvia fulva]WPV20480.1 Hsp70/Hsp90 co-chaperone cns1 [Fulvia fulva]WPV35411.1 Hsp70/Hsp90 co-chaperone cns1 [Fulvia fulva]
MPQEDIATAASKLSLHNGDAAQHKNADQFVESMTAALPPTRQKAQEMSVDELMKEMNRVPLFMTSLDETDGEGGENVMLEAIKALAHEGTKVEVAENFRTQGNEAARDKLWSDAREFYTKAIGTLRGTITTTEVEDDTEHKVIEIDEAAEAKKEREIEEACLTNRALCNLEMKNHGSCNKDCAAALRLNPRNIKAWYRAASACLSLDKIPEALDACTSGLQFDASNAALKTLSTRIAARRDYLAQLEQARIARESAARAEAAALRKGLKDRNIPTRETDSPPEMEDAKITLAEKTGPMSEMSFPVLLLYPLHAQTDFVKTFREGEALVDHLEYILPLPWDSASEYGNLDDLECYMETAQGGLIKAGKKLALIKLLGSGKVEIVDGLVRVFVVPKKRANEWIEQFKLRRGKQQ